MTFIESKLKEFERICKDCKIKNNKKRDKYLRNEYMKVYYLIDSEMNLFDCMKYRRMLKEIANKYGIQ